MNRRELIRSIADRLIPLYDLDEAKAIARLTAAEIAGVSRDALLADTAAEVMLTPRQAADLTRMTVELAAGRPVQYVLGRTEFYGRTFAVREGVLVPRPETEELVRWVADEVTGGRILDLGTGSGCIAATLALLMPGAEMWAIDRSDEALAVARENIARLRVRVKLRRVDMLRPVTEWGAEFASASFDTLVSNPPYVPESERAAMHRNVAEYEPAGALFVPDEDPLCFYRALGRAALVLLVPGGRLFVEVHAPLAQATARLLTAGGFTGVQVRDDLFGRPRMICARKERST